MKSASKLTLKIKRPNGAIEFVVVPKLKNISASQFAQIQAATRAAGRGKVLSYEVEYKDAEQATIKSSSDLFYAGVNKNNAIESMSRMGE